MRSFRMVKKMEKTEYIESGNDGMLYGMAIYFYSLQEERYEKEMVELSRFLNIFLG